MVSTHQEYPRLNSFFFLSKFMLWYVQLWTDKIDKKKKLLGMFPEIVGIDRNLLKEFPDQFSAHTIELLFPFKLPFKKSVPQNIS
jgi:hypothetical protein